MKILFSNFGIYKKGGWGRTYMLAKGISDLGYDVTILTSVHSLKFWRWQREQIDKLTVIKIPYCCGQAFIAKGFGFFTLAIRILYSIAHRFDIVHADAGHRPISGIPCRVNRFIWKSKYYTEWWDHFGKEGQYRTKSKLFKLFLGKYELWSEVNDKKSADGVIVLSEYMKRRALNIGIDESKILLLHGGANVEFIKYIDNSNEVRDKYNIPKDHLIFGFIGMTRGDLDDILPFIDAFNCLKGQFKLSWLTAGERLSPELKQKLNIGNELIEVGWIDYFSNSEILSCVDVFVLIKNISITNIAGWPNKFGDYLAFGRPIMLNAYGDLINYSNRYSFGLFLVDRNTDSIKNTIIQIIKSKESLIEMGRYNRKVAEDIYSWKDKSKQLYSFYTNTIQNE